MLEASLADTVCVHGNRADLMTMFLFEMNVRGTPAYQVTKMAAVPQPDRKVVSFNSDNGLHQFEAEPELIPVMGGSAEAVHRREKFTLHVIITLGCC